MYIFRSTNLRSHLLAGRSQITADFFHCALVVKRGEQLRRGSAPRGMLQVRRDFRQRGQDKSPQMHAWMWHLQLRRLNCPLAVNQNIQVDQSWTTRHWFFAAHEPLELS